MYVFVKVVPSDIEPGYWWATVRAPSGKSDIVDNAWPTRLEAEAGGREWCDTMNGGTNDEDRHEAAFEEGMLHGVDAYNDAMGWS